MTRLDFSAAVTMARRLLDAVGQRLLAIDVLAGLAGQDGDDRVPVVGRGDDDRVDVLAIEDLAEVAVGLGRPAGLATAPGGRCGS